MLTRPGTFMLKPEPDPAKILNPDSDLGFLTQFSPKKL